MGRPTKRRRSVATKRAASAITITQFVDSEGYSFFRVQGWKENGKWQRKRFKDRPEAERFAALKRVEQENQGRAQRMVLSPLSEEQHEQAVRAFDKLGNIYTLDDAVAFFLKHHRAPDFTIRLKEAVGRYRDEKERDGLRPRTLKAIGSVLGSFITTTNDPFVHEVTRQDVEAFLRGLRAKDGIAKATRKTWNNYRNDLHGFFAWCAMEDATTHRPFTFENPVEKVRKFSARQVREEQSVTPATTDPAKVCRILSVLRRWRGGVMVRHFALLYFAGIRPAELAALAPREGELVNRKTGIITIPANVSKTRHERQVVISDNLAAWLDAAPGPIIPVNFDRMAKAIRSHFGLSHDEARHSFISYHVALNRSIGDAALQAGNSESIVKLHYLNTHTRDEGRDFFRIVPCPSNTRAVLGCLPKEVPSAGLKAI